MTRLDHIAALVSLAETALAKYANSSTVTAQCKWLDRANTYLAKAETLRNASTTNPAQDRTP